MGGVPLQESKQVKQGGPDALSQGEGQLRPLAHATATPWKADGGVPGRGVAGAGGGFVRPGNRRWRYSAELTAGAGSAVG